MCVIDEIKEEKFDTTGNKIEFSSNVCNTELELNWPSKKKNKKVRVKLDGKIISLEN